MEVGKRAFPIALIGHPRRQAWYVIGQSKTTEGTMAGICRSMLSLAIVELSSARLAQSQIITLSKQGAYNEVTT
ncbi:MAG TPA: hypothetical protein DCS33_01150 [Gammaproteobacteria bacterium]|nr:hypothetical protein [Gammaproteobacteria bacterium]